MKFKTIFLVAIGFAIFSCTKSKEVEAEVDNTAAAAGVGTPFTNATVLPIFGKCAKCHLAGSGVSGALAHFMFNPLNYEGSIKLNIEHIYAQVNTFGKGMTTAAYGNLTQAEVDALVAWYKAGYPAK